MNGYNNANTPINCGMDEPLQNLRAKLSSKSQELYIFWTNYNQLYNHYQTQTNEIVRLRQQNERLRRQSYDRPKAQQISSEDTFLKQRYLNLQRNYESIKLQNDKLKQQTKDLRRQTQHFHEQNLQLQTLLHQLREQNNVQRQSIQKILGQLKHAQGELAQYSRLYEQVQQKEAQVARLMENERRLNEIIQENDMEIEQLIENARRDKIEYENLIRQSLSNAKTKVIESLPNLIKTSKQKIQVVSN